jgi:uncharacterized membrane protein YidH (DUF202 family)
MSDNSHKVSIKDVILSVLAAMIGVQKGKNHDRDFRQGNPLIFIFVGVILVAVFVFTLILVVKVVLP